MNPFEPPREMQGDSTVKRQTSNLEGALFVFLMLLTLIFAPFLSSPVIAIVFAMIVIVIMILIAYAF